MNINREFLKEKWTKKYRLVVLSNDSYEDKFSVKLNRLNIFVAVGMSALFLILITTLIIAITPLREYIPGYATPGLKNNAVVLNVKLDSLQRNIQQLEKYTESLKPVLLGNKAVELEELPYENVKGGYDLYQKGIKKAAVSDADKIQELYTVIHEQKKQITLLQKNISEEAQDKSTRSIAETALLKGSKKDSIFRETVAKEERFSIFGNSKKNMPFVMLSPIKGKIVKYCNFSKKQYGVLVAAGAKQNVQTIAAGIVMHASWTVTNGYVVIISHQKKYISIYKNLEKLNITQGANIKSGQVIGLMNMEQNNQKPYLYFELWKEGYPLNPVNFIKF